MKSLFFATSILLLVCFNCVMTTGQPINFKIYSPTGAVLKILYGPNKPEETTYYLKNNRLVASEAESDIYVLASETKDSIKLNAFYTGTDQLALSYTLVRKGKELQFVDYIGYEPNGNILGYAHNLISGKGIEMIKDREVMGVEIYRNGNKVGHYGLAKVEKDRLVVFTLGNAAKMQGVLNMEGDVLIPAEYHVVRLENDVFVVKNFAQKFGAFDLAGKQIVPFEYDDIIPQENLVVVWQNYKNNDRENYGLYTREGEMITGPVNPIIDFTTGPMPVLGPEGTYAFVDKTGKMVTPFTYKEARKFSDGLAGVANQKGEFGFIDLTGNLVVPFKFYNVLAGFENGKAKVSESRFKKAYEIDKSGNKVSP